MPLREGKSREVIGGNISELRAAGYKLKQSLAIALKKAGKSRSRKSGAAATKSVPSGATGVGIR